MAFFKGTATDYHDLMDILKNLAQDDHVSAAAIHNGGTGYVVGDTITLSGGTKYHEPEIEVRGVNSGDYVSGAAVNAGGTGYVVGDLLTPSTGTYSVTPVIEVTSVSGTAVTGVQINNAGICSAQPSNPVTMSGGTGSGCTLNLTFTAGTGIITQVHISDAGVYTTQATNPVLQNTTSGSGTGAKFDFTYTDTAWETLIDFEAREATAAVISAAGTGYSTNDIVTLVGGTFTEAATVQVTAQTGGVPTAVSVLTGGEYITDPSNPVSTSGGTGTGLTLTMTFAYQAAENKYLMLHNTTTDQYIGIQALYSTNPETCYLWRMTGFTGFTSTSTPWKNQPGCSVLNPDYEDTYVPLSGGASPATISYWINIQDLRITGSLKVASVYPNFYVGEIDTYLTTGEWNYPQLIMGCLAEKRSYTYTGIGFSGMNQPGVESISTTYAGPGWIRWIDGNFYRVINFYESSGNPVYEDDYVCISPAAGTQYNLPAAPNHWYGVGDNWREVINQNVTLSGNEWLKRVSNEFVLLPCTLSSKNSVLNKLMGDMIGVFAFQPDGAVNAEDRIFIGTDVYRCFQNCNKSNRNYFFAIKED